MKKLRILHLLASAGVLVLLPGCFNYDEYVEFDEKGAGHLEYRFERGTQGIFGKLASEWEFDNPVEDQAKIESKKPAGLKLEKFTKEDKDGGRTVFEGKLTFDDIGKFAQWDEHQEIVRIWGHTTVTASDDIRIFERKIIVPEKDIVDSAREKTMNSKVRLKVKGPGKILDTNGKKEGESTVVWEGEFADFIGGAIGENGTLKARFQLPSKDEDSMTNAIMIFAVALVVLIGVVIVFSRKKASTGPKDI